MLGLMAFYHVYSNIFNLPLKAIVFVLFCKSSLFLPIHRDGGRHLDHRSIAKLRVLTKLFERIVTRKIVFAITSCIPLQHGLLKGEWTVTNLLMFACHIFKTFSSGSCKDTMILLKRLTWLPINCWSLNTSPLASLYT